MDPKAHAEAYRIAQRAIAELKAAVALALAHTPDGLTNAQIGRLLGIYMGHIGHQGHIPRTLLALMQGEGLVRQETEPSKKWKLSGPERGEPDEPDA